MRAHQGGNKFYARHGGNASLLGQMVKDTLAAIDFMICRSTLRHNASLCSQHGYSVSNAGIDKIPYIDPARIYLAGFALGGTVALHVAALDSRVAGVASFAGFTPMRTDALDRPTGGVKRLYDLHALIPRLGLFAPDRLGKIPYDYEELLAAIAPRPTLLYTPQGDRDATWADVEKCVNASAAAWGGAAAGARGLTHVAPATISKMEGEEAQALTAWVKAVAARP